MTTMLSFQGYNNCNCLTANSTLPGGVHSVFGGAGSLPNWPSEAGTVSRGACASRCPNYVAYLVVTFIHIFLTGINQNPSNVITLRSVLFGWLFLFG